MKILLIENDPIIARMIENILIKNQCTVIVTTSIKEATAKLNQFKDIDIIISELVFPEQSGFDLLKYLKSFPRLSKIPSLIISAVYDQPSVLKCISMGAADYILKPVTEDMLISRIDKIKSKIARTVLLVDDDEVMIGLLQKTLEREGLESVATNNGKMALEKLEDPKNNIGIIISDIEMPEMDGLDLLKAVKKDYPDLPVILITGKGGRFNRNDVEDAGADGYITKPFKNTDIILTVKSSLGL